MESKEDKLYNPRYFAPKPSKFVCFMRVFLPWQIIRFFIINIRMLLMIRKSHGNENPRAD